MSLFNRLGRASYKGASFLLEGSTNIAGRKNVVFEFPKKTFRVVEDMGGSLRVFNITGYISGTGSDYFRARDALIRALDDPNAGDFVHPFYGTIRVTADPYQLDESIKNLGVATFSMVFRESKDNIYPTQATNNKSLINRLSQQVLQDAEKGLQNFYDFITPYKQAYRDLQDTLANITNTFATIAEPFNSGAAALSQFTVQLNSFRNNIASNLESPNRLGAAISATFSSLSNLTTDTSEQTRMMQNFFQYDAVKFFPPNTTLQRANYITNVKAINTQVNMDALSYAYNSAVQTTFTDEVQLNSIEEALDAQYYFILDNTDFDDSVLQNLKDLRNEVRIFFENSRLNIRSIVPITVQSMTITTLVYAYYANLDDDQTIIQLNTIFTPNRISGDLNILTL